MTKTSRTTDLPTMIFQRMFFFFFLPRPELSEGTSTSALISEVKERKFGQYVRIFLVSFVIKICMKVEIHGYPYVCKYSILLFFFDDRNSVCDRIM